MKHLPALIFGCVFLFAVASGLVHLSAAFNNTHGNQRDTRDLSHPSGFTYKSVERAVK